ncbi:MAG: hypothetical protein ABIJ41_05150 [Candidatus Omnitrophota bacterium]
MKKLFFLLAVLLIPALAFAETIRFKSGKTIEGRIMEKTDKYIKVDMGIGIAITYFLDEIEEIEAGKLPSSGQADPIKEKSTQQGPKEVYLDYLKAMHAAASLEELKPYLSSKSEKHEQLKELWQDQEKAKQVLDMIKTMTIVPEQIEDMQEKISGDEASLDIKAKGQYGPVEGKIRFSKENGEWKITEEKWESAASLFPGKMSEEEGRPDLIPVDFKVELEEEKGIIRTDYDEHGKAKRVPVFSYKVTPVIKNIGQVRTQCYGYSLGAEGDTPGQFWSCLEGLEPQESLELSPLWYSASQYKGQSKEFMIEVNRERKVYESDYDNNKLTQTIYFK